MKDNELFKLRAFLMDGVTEELAPELKGIMDETAVEYAENGGEDYVDLFLTIFLKGVDLGLFYALDFVYNKSGDIERG